MDDFKADLKGVIFDLDGVLVNTVDLHFYAWQRLFAELGIAFTRAEMDDFRGIHQRQILAVYASHLSETQIVDCLKRKANYYRQLLAAAQESIAYAPALRLLHEAKASGLKIGLASSSINARHVLEIVHLNHLFDAIADGTTVCRSKPAPDIFVWVAGSLGLHPGEIVVVEDGAAGVEGARLAGMFVVGISVENAVPHLNLTMDTLSFEAIIAHVGKAEAAVSVS